jgi:hypothetical protein
MRALAVSILTEPPFPSRVNAHRDEIGAQSARWAAEFGLVPGPDAARRLDRANAADLAGRACPDADPEHVALLTDLITWLFAFDDSCDDDGLGADPGLLAPVVSRLLDVLDRLGTPAPAGLLEATGPTGLALHDLCRRLRAHGRPELLLRFAGQLRSYLLSLLWEAANRQRRRVPTVAEYVQMRRHTGAVHPSFTLTDVAHGGAGTDQRADPELSRLEELAADLVCWCNDVFSWAKERHQEHDGHNLTAVIVGETGQDEEAALADAAARFNAGLIEYLRLEQRLLERDDPAVRRFVTARRCWVRGTYDWSLAARRYQ